MNKWIKRSLIGLLSISLILFTVLVIHIYQVTKPSPNPTMAWTLERIDVAQEDIPNLTLAAKTIRNQEGVRTCKVNREQGTMVFAYDTGSGFEPNKVVEAISDITPTASLFTPSEEDLATSCPVMDQESLSYRFGNFIKNTFH